MKINLRPYQAAAVAELRGRFMVDGDRHVLFCLPTGGGKTVVFSHIAEQAAARGNRVCILVHRQELVDQSCRTLREIGLEHGVVAAGYRMDLSRGCQVASVQTLARRLPQIPPDFFQLLIIDEAHHAVAGTWARLLAHFADARTLGVTATPERLDGKGLGGHFDSLILGPDPAWLTGEGFLVPARIFAPPGLDLSSIKRFDTRKGQADAEQRLQQGQAMGDAVSHYRRTIADQHNGTAIAFCVSVAHAEAVAEAFRSAGIPAAMLDGNMDRAQRRRLITDLGAGVLKVLTSCDIISEGTDIPSVTGAILLRPTDSLGLYLQQVGRVLRPAPGKTTAILNDHVGNVHRHGLPTDPRQWSLAGRVKATRTTTAQPITVCPSCFATLPAQIAQCPECGHAFPALGQREIVTIEGSLKELEQKQKKIKIGDLVKIKKNGIEWTGKYRVTDIINQDVWVRCELNGRGRVASITEIESVETPEAARFRRINEERDCQSLEELEELGRRRGYKPGWARYRWSARESRRFARAGGRQP